MKSIALFEKAAQSFVANPCQETYQDYINLFAQLIYEKVDVQAMIMFEQLPNGDPAIRLNRMTMGNKLFFAFYTSEKKAKASPFDADFANLPLDMVAELTLGDESISGLIVNPSNGADASLDSGTIKACYEGAKAYKG